LRKRFSAKPNPSRDRRFDPRRGARPQQPAKIPLNWRAIALPASSSEAVESLALELLRAP
jgi:hypothetical protein